MKKFENSSDYQCQIKSYHLSMSDQDRVAAFAKYIIDNMDDPYEMNAFWVFDKKSLESNLQEWKDHMSSVRLFYAYKCNPSPLIVKMLIDSGYSFDCASINEIQDVLGQGCTPDRIVYSQSFKPISHLVKAYELGVRLTIVDSIDEIKKVSKYAQEMSVLLRLNHNDLSAGLSLGDRFGVDIDNVEQMIQAIKESRLKFVGTHFHVGSEAHSIEVFQTGIEFAKDVFTVAQRYGFQPYIVDLGGGFSHLTQLSKIGSVIEKAFEDNDFPIGSYMIAEPGLFVALNTFSLALQIHGKKVRKETNGFDYTVYDGLHGCLAYCVSYKKEIPAKILRVFHTLKEEKYSSLFFGPTCDSHDLICSVDFPELEIGDWIMFSRCGAYSSSLATNFNGFESTNHKIFEIK